MTDHKQVVKLTNITLRYLNAAALHKFYRGQGEAAPANSVAEIATNSKNAHFLL